MELEWSPEDAAFRRELVAFLDETLPPDWDELAKDGPGSEAQAAFSRGFCAALAERGWLTPHWPASVGGRGASAWQHA
ncbi:MAG TPA: acyl-CoA dehydrogenase family protein, partial [Myxococcota bacterium]|nr:acyl-CoA dehydrogenase family protein [Myxococcota bacterium]